MHDTTPANLHTAALAAWLPTADSDPRSQQFETADRLSAATTRAAVPPSSRRAANWMRTLHAYEHFWREHNRAPRENTRNRAGLPPHERRLGEWARYQRRFDDHLSEYQRIRLDISPAFDWDPRDAIWQRHYDACERIIDTVGALPRLNAADPAEFAHARWLGRQLRLRQLGSLTAPRALALERLLQRRR